MKRAKLVAGLLSCMMCLAMLTIGVWAVASVATLNINGNLKFYPEGLFVQLSGEVYRGNSSTESEMTKLADPRFNYGPVANFDNNLDELSGNFPLEAWEIGNVAFIPNQRFIKIKVYITNYSDFAISGTPTVTIGGQDISEIITGLTVTSNTDELSSITSNTTVTYELILEATGSTEFSKNISVSFEFEELSSVVNFVQWNSVDNYYYIEMGKLSDGTPLEWRLVLERTGSESDPTDSTVEGITDDNFTGNKTELEGKTYYFLLNTWTGGTSEIDSPDACSFENRVMGVLNNYWNYNYGGASVLSNNYAASNLRKYITGTAVLRGYSGNNDTSSPALHTESGQISEESFLSKYSIEDDIVYSFISGRTLTDLYSKMSNSSADVTYDEDVAVGTSDIAGIPETTIDKLWSLSRYEALEIKNTSLSCLYWNGIYWLRSDNVTNGTRPNQQYGKNQSCCVSTTGDISGDFVISTYCTRPAFQISF